MEETKASSDAEIVHPATCLYKAAQTLPRPETLPGQVSCL